MTYDQVCREIEETERTEVVSAQVALTKAYILRLLREIKGLHEQLQQAREETR